MMQDGRGTKSFVTIAVRIHDSLCFEYLDSLLFNIYTNSESSRLQLLFCCQNISLNQETKNLLNSYNIVYKEFTLESKKDIRSKLLVEAVKRTETEYLSFLDFDDLISQDGIKHSLIILDNKPNIIATFGRVDLYECEMLNGVRYLENKIRTFYTDDKSFYIYDNAFPIHGCVFRLSNKDKIISYFDESLTRVEDYNFFAQLALLNDIHIHEREILMGHYFRYKGHINTPMDEEWDKCAKIVRKRIGKIVMNAPELKKIILGEGNKSYKSFRKGYELLLTQPTYKALPINYRIFLKIKYFYSLTFWSLFTKLKKNQKR